MSTLGIYFGPRTISLVVLRGKKVLNNIQIPHSIISPVGVLEEKVPQEVKIVTVLRDELKKNKIDIKDVVFGLSGRDLVIRNFEMPIMPRQELESAVAFEVKKYTPFRIEEMIFDFQWKIDKSVKKTRILFVGVKKETLDKYLYIANQLSFKVHAVEYSAFSILRLFKLANIREKGVIAIINADIKHDDEINFVVMEDGFPLFSRDITALAGAVDASKKEENKEEVLNKLKREVKVSLDYYERKFPFNSINKIFFMVEQDYQADLSMLAKEMALPAQFIDISKYCLDVQYTGSVLPFLKGYSVALSHIHTGIEVSILLAKEKAVKKTLAGPVLGLGVSLFTRLRYYAPLAAACLVVCFGVFLFGVYRALPLKKELKDIIDIRPAIRDAGPEAALEELKGIDADYKMRIEAITNALNKQVYFTELLDAIPRITPKGIQLASLSIENRDGQIQLSLDGAIYLANSDDELSRVKTFVEHLKENPAFNKYSLKEVSLDSVDHPNKDASTTLTHFIISCRDLKGKR